MSDCRSIFLYTDYGSRGPYVGLVHAALRRAGYHGDIVDLQHDAPAFNPQAAGALLAAQLRYLPQDVVLIAVIDPGVGGDRGGLVVKLPGMRLVGPDNGLLAPLLDKAGYIGRIDWQPESMSASFHGRDWFAPVGARLANDEVVELTRVSPQECVGYGTGTAIHRVIYRDAFGNAMTGIEAAEMEGKRLIRTGSTVLGRARTFGDVPRGEAFWYCNSLGLVEVAVNQGSAVAKLRLQIGDPVVVIE